MFWKKKYERSEWYEGVLYAEHLYSCRNVWEIFVEHTDGMQYYDILVSDRPSGRSWRVKCNCSTEFGQGVLDYLEFNKII